MKVVVTNDDGVHTPFLEPLIEALREDGHHVVAVVPERPRSAAGLARTYHKPLRVRKVGGLYVINGFPADAVFLALKLLAPDADLVISGVNVGENIGLEATYGSGTVGAAIQGGVLGVPSLALSMEVGGDIALMKKIVKAAVETAGWGIEDFLAVSLNIPNRWGGGLYCPSRLARIVYRERLYENIDPRGDRYYWRWGDRVDRLDEGTDAYYFYIRRGVTALGITERGVAKAEPFVGELAVRIGAKYIKC
ncbi:MAG: 5'/3'-nucleotidase SurE [Pyrobaculum sp.]